MAKKNWRFFTPVIKKIIKQLPWLAFADPEEFVFDAVRLRLERFARIIPGFADDVRPS